MLEQLAKHEATSDTTVRFSVSSWLVASVSKCECRPRMKSNAPIERDCSPGIEMCVGLEFDNSVVSARRVLILFSSCVDVTSLLSSDLRIGDPRTNPTHLQLLRDFILGSFG